MFARHCQLARLPRINFRQHITKSEFIQTLEEQQIIYAIKHLQVNALKKYIKKNFIRGQLVNSFEELLNSVYPIDKNKEAAIAIIRLLIIDHYDDFVQLMCLLRTTNKPVLELMGFIGNDDKFIKQRKAFLAKTKALNSLNNKNKENSLTENVKYKTKNETPKSVLEKKQI